MDITKIRIVDRDGNIDKQAVQNFYDECVKNSDDYRQAYFTFLKTHKPSNEITVFGDCSDYIPGLLRHYSHYDMISFRTEICEIFHQCIKYFPEICEYTIKCVNENGPKYLKIGYFDEIDEVGKKCLAKLITPDNFIPLSKQDIYELYVANKVADCNTNAVNGLVSLLHGEGSLPKITTSYKLNKKMIKTTSKF